MNQTELFQSWNRQHGPGTHVKYQRKTGSLGMTTTTRSAAFLAPNGQAVIRLNGMAGVYPLELLQVTEIKKGKS